VHNLLIALIGSLLALDTTVAFQFLISQPLFSCTLIGYLSGNPMVGLQVGFYLQLIWLSSLPVGAAILPEGNTAAIVIAALVTGFYNGDNFYSLLVIGLFYGLLISYFGGELVVLYRKTNTFILHKAITFAGKGETKYLSYINLFALSYHFFLMFILIIAALTIGDFLFGYLSQLPSAWEVFFKYGAIGLLGTGVGLVLPFYKSKIPRFILLAGFVIGNGLFFILK
jgi:mannose/fructose/N-acetylgalactosamine-specific phosphotransferase system component IIC